MQFYVKLVEARNSEQNYLYNIHLDFLKHSTDLYFRNFGALFHKNLMLFEARSEDSHDLYTIESGILRVCFSSRETSLWGCFSFRET